MVCVDSKTWQTLATCCSCWQGLCVRVRVQCVCNALSISGLTSTSVEPPTPRSTPQERKEEEERRRRLKALAEPPLAARGPGDEEQTPTQQQQQASAAPRLEPTLTFHLAPTEDIEVEGVWQSVAKCVAKCGKVCGKVCGVCGCR